MDITTDGFGYMLAFGNLTWVPMVYGLQARYLAFHPVELGLVNSALISALIVAGIVIFRQSNSEKFEFRHGRNPKSETRSRDVIYEDILSLTTTRLDVPRDAARHQAPDLWLVGPIKAPQLLR